jgi:hypothetical protein
MAPPSHLLVHHQWNGWEWRIRRLQRIRQLERVLVLLVDMNAKPLLQLVLVLAPLMAVPLQVLLQRRQLLQVLLQHRQLLQIPGKSCCNHALCLVLGEGCSSKAANLPSRLLGATVSLSWKLVRRMILWMWHQPPGLGTHRLCPSFP